MTTNEKIEFLKNAPTYKTVIGVSVCLLAVLAFLIYSLYSGIFNAKEFIGMMVFYAVCAAIAVYTVIDDFRIKKNLRLEIEHEIKNQNHRP